MKVELDLITIFTDDIDSMKAFYSDVLGLSSTNELDDYIEYGLEKIRFAICSRATMTQFSSAYSTMRRGNNFELAFKCASKEELIELHKRIINSAGSEIMAPTTMPWGHYTSLFADPDGNIHELFVI